MKLTNKEILITGGTSGLGKALVFQFLQKGAIVTALGKKETISENSLDSFHFHQCDQSRLSDVVDTAGKISKEALAFDIIINNAGILSPPDFQQTIDGFESSLQINFLSHVLLNHLLISNQAMVQVPLVINITSMVRDQGKLEFNIMKKDNYNSIKAYSNSKLFAFMFSKKLVGEGYNSFSFDPWIFSSEIYRQQKKWFHHIYKIASPFMLSSEKVAKGLVMNIEKDLWENGKIINRKGKISAGPVFREKQIADFWNSINEKLKKWI